MPNSPLGLDRGIGLALGHLEALGEQLEVVDQILHAGFQHRGWCHNKNNSVASALFDFQENLKRFHPVSFACTSFVSIRQIPEQAMALILVSLSRMEMNSVKVISLRPRLWPIMPLAFCF